MVSPIFLFAFFEDKPKLIFRNYGYCDRRKSLCRAIILLLDDAGLNISKIYKKSLCTAFL